MTWLLWIIGAVAFFYVVGRLTSKPEQGGISVSKSERTVTRSATREKYLPWSDEPYQHTHRFELFGTDAGLGWSDDDDTVYVWCVSRFSKGKPATKVYMRYYYGTADKIWHDPPPGAARECLKEIEKVLMLK